jgi:hypothetical protein
MKRFFNLLKFFGGGLLVAYLGLLRPRMARWNASDAEVHGPHPGDELVPHPLLQTTLSITIQAPAEQAWPWLVQIGYGRGGFYSYDRLERLAGLEGLHSAHSIDPELQKLKRGDTLQISPVTPMMVEVFQKNRAMVLHTVMSPLTAQVVDRRNLPPPWIDWSWAFLLAPLDASSCRLTSRVRATYAPYLPLWPLIALVIEPASFIMDRKMLETIKKRAEG